MYLYTRHLAQNVDTYPESEKALLSKNEIH